MKKLFLALVVLTSFIGNSQNKKGLKKSNLTVEQKVELLSKKMKLDLDLTDTQLTEVKKLLTIQASKREELKQQFKDKKEKGEKPSSDEIFAMQNKKLDDQIAMKAEMKRILNPEQYAKWEKLHSEREHKMKGRFGKKAKMKMEDDDLPPMKD